MNLNEFILDSANNYHKNTGGYMTAYCKYLSKNFTHKQIKEKIKEIRNPKYEEEIIKYFNFNKKEVLQDEH